MSATVLRFPRSGGPPAPPGDGGMTPEQQVRLVAQQLVHIARTLSFQDDVIAGAALTHAITVFNEETGDS